MVHPTPSYCQLLADAIDLGVFFSSEGTHTRQRSLLWPNSPEAIVYSNPYIYSSVPSMIASGSNNIATSAIEVTLAPTLLPLATLTLPESSTSIGQAITSLIPLISTANTTPAQNMKSTVKVLFSSLPMDKSSSAAEGSSIWALQVQDIGDQIDDLVREGRVDDAIGLVESVGENGLDSNRQIKHLKTLQAVVGFSKGQYQSAIDTFLTFNINPALVISLFPEASISGPLHVQRDKWMELFGAVPGSKLQPEEAEHQTEAPTKGILKSIAQMGGMAKKSSLDSLKPTQSTRDDSGPEEKVAPIMSGEEGEFVGKGLRIVLRKIRHGTPCSS